MNLKNEEFKELKKNYFKFKIKIKVKWKILYYSKHNKKILMTN